MDRVRGKRYDYISFTMTNGIAVVLKIDKYFNHAHSAYFSNMKQGGVVFPYNYSLENNVQVREVTEKYYDEYLDKYNLANCADSTEEKIHRFVTARLPLFTDKPTKALFETVYTFTKYQLSFYKDRDGNKMFSISSIDECITKLLSIFKAG